MQNFMMMLLFIIKLSKNAKISTLHLHTNFPKEPNIKITAFSLFISSCPMPQLLSK